jgi:hypothetical protein
MQIEKCATEADSTSQYAWGDNGFISADTALSRKKGYAERHTSESPNFVRIDRTLQ